MFGIGKGIKIGKLFGVEIELDYTWFLIFGLLTWLFSGFYDGPLFFGILVGIFASILFFVSLLFHEFSHITLARINGILTSKVRMFFFGAAAFLEDLAKTPGAEFVIAVAGPVASFIAAGIFFGLSFGAFSLNAPEFMIKVFSSLVFLNIILGSFNLIPAFPLDGGRCLSAILWKILNDAKKAMKAAYKLGEWIGWFMIGYGAISLLGPILGVQIYIFIHPIWAIVIGWIIKDAAKSQYFAFLLARTKVKDIDYKKFDFVEIKYEYKRLYPVASEEEFCSLDDNLASVVKKLLKNKPLYLRVYWGDVMRGTISLSDIERFLKENQ